MNGKISPLPPTSAAAPMLTPADFDGIRQILHSPEWMAGMARELVHFQRVYQGYPFTLDPDTVQPEDLMVPAQPVVLPNGSRVVPVMTRIPLAVPVVYCVIATLGSRDSSDAYELLFYEDSPIDINKRRIVDMPRSVIQEVLRQLSQAVPDGAAFVFSYLAFLVDQAMAAAQPPLQPTPV